MEERRIRKLEMIQGIINRMASNSFLLKGWAVTMAAGILAININAMTVGLYLLIYLSILLFWSLDTYYLKLERLYRKLYENSLTEEAVTFDLQLPAAVACDRTTFVQSFVSKTEMGFYIPITALVTLVVLFI